MNEIKRLLKLKSKTTNECWMTSQMRLNLERAYAKEELAKDILKIIKQRENNGHIGTVTRIYSYCNKLIDSEEAREKNMSVDMAIPGSERTVNEEVLLKEEVEKSCRRCGISQTDYGFEFNNAYDGEDICEDCEEEERDEQAEVENDK